MESPYKSRKSHIVVLCISSFLVLASHSIIMFSCLFRFVACFIKGLPPHHERRYRHTVQIVPYLDLFHQEMFLMMRMRKKMNASWLSLRLKTITSSTSPALSLDARTSNLCDRDRSSIFDGDDKPSYARALRMMA